MTWPTIILWTGHAVLWPLIGFSAWNLRRIHILQRATEQTQARYDAEIERVQLLNNLLLRLCVHAASTDTAPIWRAWADTMGTISVEVHGQSWDGEPPHLTPMTGGERTEPHLGKGRR